MFVRGVCGRMCDAVWCVVLFCVFVVCLCVCFVHAFVAVVRDLLCGDVWFGCVLCLFVSHCFESVCCLRLTV